MPFRPLQSFRASAAALAALAVLGLSALLAPATVRAQNQSTCTAWLATDPVPAGIPAVTGSGVTQRASLVASGGKLVAISNRYYAVYIPTAFYTATTPVVVMNLHGTAGYPEAEWNDWHSTMGAYGHAFIALYWVGSNTVSDSQAYSDLKQILQEVGANCPIAGARKALMGFSVGSALSFAVMVRDTAGAKIFSRHVAISGAAWSPLDTGISIMHPTVESARPNANSVHGVKSWLYCGVMDTDHTWSMCNEMPLALAFVNEHGGSATLYQDPTGTHHSLPTSAAGYAQMYAFLSSSESAPNYTSLWWIPTESGWGLNVNHQGDIVFATLFTYDSAGRALWLYLPAGSRQSDGVTFSGRLYRATGPAFNAQPFTPITAANLTDVGTMSISFSGANAGTLTYSVNGASVAKGVQRYVFGARAADCVPGTGSRAGLANYQDLWWNPAESGWGLNVTHQDNTMFATLFTYGSDGRDLWLFMPAGQRQADGSYTGDLDQATGPAFNAQPFTPISAANVTKVGTMTLRFSSGTSGTLSYTVNGAAVTKAIQRYEFSSPVPSCS